MQYKLKDKKIQIARSETKKVNGVNTKVWTNLVDTKIWAFYQQHAGSASLTDVNGLKVYDSTERATFVINNRADVRPAIGDLIVFREKFYDVIAVDDYQGYREDLKITAEIADKQGASNYSGLVIL